MLATPTQSASAEQRHEQTPEQTLEQLTEKLQLAPTDAELLVDRAALHERAGQLDAAFADLRSALAFDRTNAAARTALERVLRAIQDQQMRIPHWSNEKRTLKSLTELVSNANNASVSQVFLNEKQIEMDAKRLQTQLGIYHSQTQQWLELVDQFNASLKTLGDVENWSGVLERDIQEITMTLAVVRQGSHRHNS
eukprot:jgi/Hompol1/1441/HPOL_004353-RA